MEFYDVVNERRSVRSFQTKPVEPEKVERIFEAVRKAPSVLNLQPWKFLLIQAPEQKEKVIGACLGQSFALKAPLLVVACGLPTNGDIGGYASSLLADVSAAFTHFCLAAAAEGLGTCWISAFDNEEMKQALKIPPNAQVVALSPLGYASESRTGPKDRKPREEILSFGAW